jgi:hypothetical protein
VICDIMDVFTFHAVDLVICCTDVDILNALDMLIINAQDVVICNPLDVDTFNALD